MQTTFPIQPPSYHFVYTGGKTFILFPFTFYTGSLVLLDKIQGRIPGNASSTDHFLAYIFPFCFCTYFFGCYGWMVPFSKL